MNPKTLLRLILSRGSKVAVTAGLALLLLAPMGSLRAIEESATRSWDFDVFLDDSRIGSHQFSVHEAGAGFKEVRSNADFNVKVLFVNVFSYQHETSEVWSNGCLDEINSSTRANGKRFSVSGKRTAEGFVVDDGDASESLGQCVMTFAYWNPEFLAEKRLLDPQTGKYVVVDVEQLESAPIEVDGSIVNANRFRIKADKIEVTVWYSPNQEWLRLDSPAKGGRTLTYRLS